MSFDCTQIGERIRYYRTKAGMSQSDLASALFIASNHYISRLETGKDAPSLELIITMADLFHCTTDDLLNNQKKMTDLDENKSDPLSDCPQELRPVMKKLMTAIRDILVENYKK